MKIAGTGPAQTSSLRRRGRTGAGSDASFTEQLGQSRAPAGAVQVQQTGGLEGLLSLQEVDDEGGRRRRAKEQGEALLDRLDEIRHALLAGSLNPTGLETLLKQIRRQRIAVSDPRLRDILGEIELRAAVELAKMGRAA